MEVEKKLREILSIILTSANIGLSEEELIEIKDIIKNSDDPSELEQVKERIVEHIFKYESKEKKILSVLEDIAKCLADLTNLTSFDFDLKDNVEESLYSLVNRLNEIRDKIDCLEKKKIQLLSDTIKEVVSKLEETDPSDDIKFMSKSVIEKIERDHKVIFSPEIVSRISRIIEEKQKKIERERAKLREKLKKIIKSIIDTINTIGKSENMLINDLNSHVSEIEEAMTLDTIEEVAEKLANISKNIRITIEKIHKELQNTRNRLNETAKLVEIMKRELEEYKQRAIMDELTGVLNRRGIMNELSREIERSKRYSTPLSIALLDIDDFKKVNDTYGHLVGDKVLCAVANILKNSVRKIDIVGRYGGEEFLIIFPNTEVENAAIAAEKLRKEVEKYKFKYKENIIRITISIGIAEYTEGDTPDTLIQRADMGMYAAKEDGKNKVKIILKEDEGNEK